MFFSFFSPLAFKLKALESPLLNPPRLYLLAAQLLFATIARLPMNFLSLSLRSTGSLLAPALEISKFPSHLTDAQYSLGHVERLRLAALELEALVFT